MYAIMTDTKIRNITGEEDSDGREGSGGASDRNGNILFLESEDNGGRRKNHFEYDPQIAYEQRVLADELGHSKFASRERKLVVQNKNYQNSGEGNFLQSHPAMEGSAYNQGIPPSLADVFNNPQALEELLQRDPNELDPQLRKVLANKLGLTNKLQHTKKNTPTPF